MRPQGATPLPRSRCSPVSPLRISSPAERRRQASWMTWRGSAHSRRSPARSVQLMLAESRDKAFTALSGWYFELKMDGYT